MDNNVSDQADIFLGGKNNEFHILHTHKKLVILVSLMIIISVFGLGAFYLGKRSSNTVINTTSPTVSVTSTPASDKSKIYHNEELGIEFSYRSDWLIEEKMHIKDMGESYTDGYVKVQSPDDTASFRIYRNPYEYYSPGQTIHEETLNIYGSDAKLLVKLDCGAGVGTDCPSMSLDGKDYKIGYVTIEDLQTKEGNKWFITNHSWTPENPLTLNEAVAQTKEFVSTIKFLE